MGEKITSERALYERALTVAVAAHQGQTRKTDGSPYITHPIMVARIVEQHGFAPTVIAAALTHDVLEDTPVTEAELRAQLGDAVVDIVIGVSENKTLAWEERKQQYIAQVVAAGEDVKGVSAADKVHNLSTMIEYHTAHGDDLWTHFSRGREQTIWFYQTLYERLAATWHHPLMDAYQRVVTTFAALD